MGPNDSMGILAMKHMSHREKPSTDFSNDDNEDKDYMTSPHIDLLALIIAVLGVLVLLNEI